MINQETYLKMKELIEEYEKNINSSIDLTNQPYIEVDTVEVETKYNRLFGDNKLCKCGHTYYRHFDPYEKMEACGCKYCECFTFEENI